MHDVLPTSPNQGARPRVSISGPGGAGKSTLAALLEAETGIRAAGSASEAAQSDIALVVADAVKGLDEAARSAVAVACSSGAAHVVLCVNKLDRADWNEQAYRGIAAEFEKLTARFEHVSATSLPIVAASGDNVGSRSAHAPWYAGLTLVELIHAIASDPRRNARPMRFPVDAVRRPDPDHRHYLGTLGSGTLRVGQTVLVAVSGVKSTVSRILVDGSERDHVSAGERAAVELADHVDVGSGDLLADAMQHPEVSEQFAAHIAWLSETPLLPGREYALKIGPREVTASITTVKHRVDIDSDHHEAARTLRHGEIGACTISTSSPVAIDPFAQMPQTGRFVLCERHTSELIATGTVDFALRRGVNIHLQPLSVSKSLRAQIKGQRPCILWFTGLSGAGKSTIANLVESKLAAAGQHTYLLDGDNLRHGLNKDLGFTQADRAENIRRVGEVAKLFVDSGAIVLCSFISPFRAERAAVRGLVGPSEFLEIYVNAPLAVCERRDPKGLYAKSRAGALPNFTGIDSPYEPPEHADLVLESASAAASALAEEVIALLRSRGIVATSSRD